MYTVRQKKRTNFLLCASFFSRPLLDRNWWIFSYDVYIRLKESRSISCSSMYISFWHALRVLQRQWNFSFTQSSNELDDYWLVFIVSISLLRKIFNACQNLIYGIVAYTFLNICEKIHQFPSSIERDAHERKSVPLFTFYLMYMYVQLSYRYPPHNTSSDLVTLIS